MLPRNEQSTLSTLLFSRVAHTADWIQLKLHAGIETPANRLRRRAFYAWKSVEQVLHVGRVRCFQTQSGLMKKSRRANIAYKTSNSTPRLLTNLNPNPLRSNSTQHLQSWSSKPTAAASTLTPTPTPPTPPFLQSSTTPTRRMT